MHNILVFRHGIAETPEDAAAEGRDEFARELTAAGVIETTAAAAGLAVTLDEIHIIGSSPLVRAIQSAELLAAAFRPSEVAVVEALSPGVEDADVLAWVVDRADDTTVALVAHEPDLGDWISWLLTGEHGDLVEVKKASAIMLSLPHEGGAGDATLIWSIPSQVLRRLS